MMPDRSLRTWIFVPFTLVVTVIAAIVVIGLPARFVKHAEAWTEQRVTALTLVVAQSVTAGVEFGDADFVRARLAWLGVSSDAVFATVSLPDGRALASWGAQPTALPADEGGPMAFTVGDMWMVRVPLRGRSGQIGLLTTGFTRNALLAEWAQEQMFAALVSLALLAAGAIGAWWYGSSVTRPLRQLTEAAQHADADAVARAAEALRPGRVYTRDERMVLIGVFADMGRRLADQVADLETQRARAVEAEDAARRASDVKSQFLANMSHELRTPLNAIIGYAEMLLDSDHLDPDERADLDRIADAGRHLVALINDILDLTKVEADRMPIVPAPFDASRAMREVLASVQPQMAKQRNALVVRFDGDLDMNSDELRVRQCVLNLLSNAAKFTKDGTVTLDVVRCADWVHFRVSDTGEGIAPDKLALLFRPFVQIDTSPTRRHGGTGLGLVLTRRLAQMLGGEVTVQSEPGVGSTFELKLPARCPAWSPRHTAPREERRSWADQSAAV